jgi:hypothetical protein
MRPYLAVIKDSFREAIHSRVLWILLGVITLVLLALAPLGYRVSLTTTFSWADVQDAKELVQRLHDAGTSLAPSRGKRLWNLWDEATRDALSRFARSQQESDGQYVQSKRKLVEALNELLAKRDLYDPELWPAPSLSKEARDLVDKPRDRLTSSELARLNRILIEATFPGQFGYRPSEAVQPTYFGMVLIEQFPFTKAQTESAMKDWILPWTMQVIVGIIGVLAAVLVTSPIVPQMFEPGSISLLLSKPVSRQLLFLSKFIGGCAFTLLSSTYLIVGLWLIVGLQTGIWNHGMLWCIPVFMLLFLVYYSVSALAGLIWKSAVVSVVVTAVFWVGCLLLDGVHWIFDEALPTQFRIVRLVEADGTHIGVLESGVVVRWDTEQKRWERVAREPPRQGFPKTIGPYYHAKSRQIVLGSGWRPPFGLGRPSLSLQVARAGEGWQVKAGPSLPSGTATFFFDSDQSLLAVNADGIHRLAGELGPPKADVKVLGFTIPLGVEGFRPVSEGLAWQEPLEAAIHPKLGFIAVYSRGNVQKVIFDKSRKLYVAGPTLELEGDPALGVSVACAGDAVLVARTDGNLWLIDAEKWTVRRKLAPDPDSQPRFVAADPAGKWLAVLYQNDYLWLIDAQAGTASKAPIRGQGDISAAAFGSQGLMAADRIHRVTTCDRATLRRTGAIGPPLTVAETIYYYAVVPIYAVVPKPRLLDQTVSYLITGKETQDWGLAAGEMELKRDQLQPWKPVRSSLAFMVAMLAIGCLYVHFQEF